MRVHRIRKRWLVFSIVGALILAFGGASGLLAVCGPFTDLSAGATCNFVVMMYYLGVAGGTSPTTYDPTSAVTRGQMAIFLGALYNNVKRNENPFRVGNRLNNNIFHANYESYNSANTNHPNGFCSDGMYNFVANQGNNKIDIYYNGLGSGFVGTYTTTTANNRLVCSPSHIYATSPYGTTVKRINIHTGLVDDPWVTLPAGVSGAGDIANAGFNLAVTTNTGIVVISTGAAANCSSGCTNVPLGGFTYGVVVDNNGNFWANTDTTLKKVSQAGSVLQTVTLSGSASGNGWYPVFDGSSIWVPLFQNGLDIVRSDGVLVDHRPLTDITNATDVLGGGFDGRHVFFNYRGDFGCGPANGNIVLAYEASTHAPLQAIGTLCGDGIVFTLGFDGRYVHGLGYTGSKHYIW